MAYTIDKVDVWAGSIEDRPGSLAERLAALAGAGANLEFVIARRDSEQPGRSVVFLAPLTGAKQRAAATKAGLSKAANLFSLRLAGPDKAGLGAKITGALGAAGINMRGISAAALGKNSVVYFAFDEAADQAKARGVLKKALAGK